MNRFTIVLIVILSLQITVSSQSCPPEGITFTSQEQIDIFQTNHPNCKDLEGDVIISGADITNLTGLSVLTSIAGDLWIYFNTSLTNLIGLDNVTSVGGDLWIWGNYNLNSLIGLDNVTSIGGNLLIGAPSFSGYGNPSLTNLTGLEGLTSIGGSLWIENNASLTNLTGLDNLTSIGDNLYIHNNDALTSLMGLGNIDLGSIINLYIFNNQNLSICAVQSVCDYLASPTRYIEIHDNASNCKSFEEVDSACVYVSVKELTSEVQSNVYPNPILTSAIFEYDLREAAMVSLYVYNHLGQQIETLVDQQQQTGKHQVTWNAEGLPAGIYFYRLQAGEQSVTGKMVVIR